MSDHEGICTASHGVFADRWHSISKSIALLASTIAAKAVIDVGISYIAVMCCIAAVAMMCLWNVRLKMCLSHEKHVRSLETARLVQSGETLRTTQRDLLDAKHDISVMESIMGNEQQKTRDRLDKALSDLDSAYCKISSLEENSRTQQKDELEKSNSKATDLGSELAKVKGELVEARSTMALLEAKRNGELEQANSKVTYLGAELAKVESELAEAKSIMAILQTEQNNELEQANSKVTYLGSELAKVEGELAEAKSIMAFLQEEECPTPKRHRWSY
jgi:chromosome segregation ATPase